MLNHELVELEGLRIFGSPRTPDYGSWAFMYPEAEAEQQWEGVPPCDILMTHGPPRGVLDLTSSGERAGCPALLARVQALAPRLHVFGHIHEARGVEVRAGTMLVNAAMVNLQYRPVHGPVVVYLDRVTRQVVAHEGA